MLNFLVTFLFIKKQTFTRFQCYFHLVHYKLDKSIKYLKYISAGIYQTKIIIRLSISLNTFHKETVKVSLIQSKQYNHYLLQLQKIFKKWI